MWPRATLLLQKRFGSYEDQSDRFQRDGIENQKSFCNGPRPIRNLRRIRVAEFGAECADFR